MPACANCDLQLTREEARAGYCPSCKHPVQYESRADLDLAITERPEWPEHYAEEPRHPPRYVLGTKK